MSPPTRTPKPPEKPKYRRLRPEELANTAARLDRMSLAEQLDTASAVLQSLCTGYEITGAATQLEYTTREHLAAACHEAAARLRGEQAAAAKAAAQHTHAQALARVEAFQSKLPYADR